MNITETFLLYAAGALLWALIGAGICWAFMSINRPDDDEDDAEQVNYLKQADEQITARKRLAAYKPYPSNIESKS